MTPLLVKLLRLVGNTDLDALTRSEAFWAAAELIWKHTDKQIERNPWAERIIYNLMANKNLAISGCASSSKSSMSGAYVVMLFWSDPIGTKIMATSTDIKGAKNRIWAQICEFFMAGVKSRQLPGRLINSLNLIIPDNENGEIVSDRMGIQLYSGETKKEKECIQKWIGIKNQRVILVLDEMPYLGPQLIAAAQSNLMSNPYFQMVGLGNFRSKLDPFGQFATPVGGWETVDVETEEWETNCNGIKGLCIRLDGAKSPNVIAGRDLWTGIYSNETFRMHCKLGLKSPGFWQMCRSYPTPQGIGNQIYSETHFDGCYGGSPTWLTKKIRVAALDPAFTNGGDRTQMIVAEFGDTTAGDHLHLIHFEELTSDVTKSDPRDYQIARIFRDKCKQFGVKPENAALDATGSGGGLFSIVCMEWSNQVNPIFFWGAASERPSSTVDFRPGYEVYFNRSAELWDQGREYFARKMVTGVTVDLSQELCAREYDKIGGVKIKIESKKDMKDRIGKSPDCFVAGTLVTTDCGDIPIEQIMIGDRVLTPFGYSEVIATHVSQTTELTKLSLRSGSSLCGKGAHKIFTWETGWTRMDKMLLHNSIESIQGIHLWNLLNALFIKDTSIEFKQLVDTIKTKTNRNPLRRDFYIDLFGVSTMEIFRRIIVSIIKTGIGRIIKLRILNSWKNRLMANYTWLIDSSRKNFERSIESISIKPLKQQCIGMDQRMELNGILKMATLFGRKQNSESKLEHVNIAETNFQKVESILENSAQLNAETGKPEIGIKPLIESVASAILAFLHGNLAQHQHVVSNVEEFCVEKPCEVYNLTLRNHNVYYANGILVQNCADAFLIMLDLCRQRFNFMPTRPLGTEVPTPSSALIKGDGGYFQGLDDFDGAGTMSEHDTGSGTESVIKRALAAAKQAAFNGRPSDDIHNPYWTGNEGLFDR